MFSSSFFTSVRGSSRVSDAIYTHVLSAYIFGVILSKQLSKSFMGSMKNKGPKHELCGIPQFVLLLLDLAQSD